MIIYTVICRSRDTAVLVEVSSPELLSGNAPQVTATLLGHLHDHPEILAEGERKTFVQRNQDDFDFFSSFIESCASAFGEESVPDEHYFHVYFTQGVYYCCIGDDSDIRDQKVYVQLVNGSAYYVESLSNKLLFCFFVHQKLCTFGTDFQRIHQALSAQPNCQRKCICIGQGFQADSAFSSALPQCESHIHCARGAGAETLGQGGGYAKGDGTQH